MKTLLEIAREANVPKMKVWRYIKKHNIDTFQHNGALRLSDTVANDVLKALSQQNNHNSNTQQNHNTDTEHVTINNTLIITLQEQLKTQTKLIENLTKLLDQEQQLHLSTKQELKHEKDKLQISEPKKSFFKNIFKK